jgi:lysophospholipase L1-like esterase
MKYLAVFVSLLVLLSGCQQAQPPASKPAVPLVEERWVSVIGDSYTGGSPAGEMGDKGWSALVANNLRADGIPVTLHPAAEGGITEQAKLWWQHLAGA